MADSNPTILNVGVRKGEVKSREDATVEHFLVSSSTNVSDDSVGQGDKTWAKLDLFMLPVIIMIYFVAILVGHLSRFEHRSPLIVTNLASSAGHCKHWLRPNRRAAGPASDVRYRGKLRAGSDATHMHPDFIVVQPCGDCWHHVSTCRAFDASKTNLCFKL